MNDKISTNEACWFHDRERISSLPIRFLAKFSSEYHKDATFLHFALAQIQTRQSRFPNWISPNRLVCRICHRISKKEGVGNLTGTDMLRA